MTSWPGWKMLLCKRHSFWKAPCLSCSVIVMLFYSERKWLEEFSHNITLEVQSLSHQIKSYYIFGIKTFLGRYTEIYRYLLSECFRNCAVQMLFFDTIQKHVYWKICKVRKAFGCVSGTYYFQCQVNWSS